MKTHPSRHGFIQWLFIVFGLLSITACAFNSQVVDHAFGFDCRYDGQEDSEVLDYRYGNSKLPVHAPDWALKEGRTFCYEGVHGPMLRGEFLYVKWRVKSTGQVYEDRVDLRQRLPENITDHRITFIIRGPQLYIYLVTPNRRDKKEPPNGPAMTDYLKTLTIYPDL